MAWQLYIYTGVKHTLVTDTCELHMALPLTLKYRGRYQPLVSENMGRIFSDLQNLQQLVFKLSVSGEPPEAIGPGKSKS